MNSILQPFITLLFTGLTWLHSFTSDWGVGIILLTIIVRIVVFPLNLRAARQQFQQAKMQRTLAALRQTFAKDRVKLLEETGKAYQQFGIKPVTMFTASVIQAPIFLSLYRVFTTHGASMTSHIVPWISTLGQVDPFHLVPVIYAIITLISMLIPLTSDMAAASSMFSRAAIPAIMVIGMFIVMWSSPVAIGIYWTTNSLFTIAERGMYRTPLGKKWLMRELPAMPTPSF